MWKKLFIVTLLTVAISARSQTPGFTRSGVPLPFISTSPSNYTFSVDRGGGLSPANMTLGTLRNLVKPSYNVLDYGADPTGVSSSQAAIQAAISAACVNPSKPVYIPAGTYIMGNVTPLSGFLAEGWPACLMVWSNNVVIVGDGPGKTVLKPGGTPFSSMRNFLGVPGTLGDGTTPKYQTNFTMIGITLDADNKGSAQLLYDSTQIYNVFGDSGVVLRDCEFLNNANNDGIDVQYGGNLTVQNCRSSNNGGDALGVQDTITRISDSLFERSGQEGLELNEIDCMLSGVVVRSNNAVATINCYKFVATGCTFQGTNNAAHSSDVGAFYATRLIQFNGCLFEETGDNAAFASVFVRPEDCVSFDNCEFRSAGKTFLFATNADNVSVTGCTFGQQNWPGTFGALNITKAEDVNISGNYFYNDGYHALIATNGIKRLKVRGNTFRGPVVLSALTNVSFCNNIFDAGGVLNVTNVYWSTFSANTDIAANFGLVQSNIFVGNLWAAVPVGNPSYWTNSLSGDVVTNRLIYAGQGENRNAVPYFPSGLMVAGGNATISGLSIGTAGTGFSEDTGALRLNVGGTTIASLGSGGIYEQTSGKYSIFSTHYAGSGSVSAPSYNFAAANSDYNTGFFRPAEDQVAIACGGNTLFNPTLTNNRAIWPMVLENSSPAFVPPSSTTTNIGVPGQLAWDGSYFYVCTAVTDVTNRFWKRMALDLTSW